MGSPPIASIARRFGAGVVDSLILLPLGYLVYRVEQGSRSMALMLAFPSLAMTFFYTIFFHARFGQTVGKMVAKIRVVQLDGTRIGWTHAFRRSAVDLAISLAGTVFLVRALLAITDAAYLENVRANDGFFVSGGEDALWWISTIWGWSEIGVALTNPSRRALHDLLAGTIVVATSPATSGSPGTT